MLEGMNINSVSFDRCKDLLGRALESLRKSKGYYQALRVETIQTPEDVETTNRLILQLQDLIPDVERAMGQMDTLIREATIAERLAVKLATPPASSEPSSASRPGNFAGDTSGAAEKTNQENG